MELIEKETDVGMARVLRVLLVLGFGAKLHGVVGLGLHDIYIFLLQPRPSFAVVLGQSQYERHADGMKRE